MFGVRTPRLILGKRCSMDLRISRTTVSFLRPSFHLPGFGFQANIVEIITDECKLAFGRRKLFPICLGTCSTTLVLMLFMAARICQVVCMSARWMAAMKALFPRGHIPEDPMIVLSCECRLVDKPSLQSGYDFFECCDELNSNRMPSPSCAVSYHHIIRKTFFCTLHYFWFFSHGRTTFGLHTFPASSETLVSFFF